jgi:hypothetical protein
MSTTSEKAIEAIVLGGALQPLGMPRFSQAMDPDDAKLTLEYIRSAAADLR